MQPTGFDVTGIRSQDPKRQPGAYITLAGRLYEVLCDTQASTMLRVRDAAASLDAEPTHLSLLEVARARLVRAAPTFDTAELDTTSAP